MIKKLFKPKAKDKPLPSRITNDTMAEHREKVLAGGRKHKYPIQYTRRRLIWNTIFISLGVLALAVALVWFQLYVRKSTGELTYRVAAVVPAPIASIDGEMVRYGDYLLYQRSTVAAYEFQGREEAADKASFQRLQAMDRALEDAYARKLAREYKIKISPAQIEQSIKEQRDQRKLSPEAYSSVVKEHLRWSADEMRYAIGSTLLLQAVSFSVDQPASDISKQVNNLVKSGKTLQQISEELGGKVNLVADLSVPIDNSDGGLSQAAQKQQPLVVSAATKTMLGDGYYFIVLNSKTDSTVNYSYLKVPLTVFRDNFSKLKKEGKVRYFVDVK